MTVLSQAIHGRLPAVGDEGVATQHAVERLLNSTQQEIMDAGAKHL